VTEEKKGDLANFLVQLALDAEKQAAFRQDPEKTMEAAVLTEEQKQLIRTASPYLAFLPTSSSILSGTLRGKSGINQPKTIVVVIVVVVVVAP
jgi:hypothetical protein